MGEEREGDDSIVVDGNEELEGAPEPIPVNLADPKPSRNKKERAMVEEGSLPNQKVMVKRLAPDRVVNPATNLAVRCEGQYKVWKGQFTRDEIEEMVHTYFGGGMMRIVQQNDDMNSKEFGRMMGRFSLTFPGEPNMQNVIADCLTSTPVPVGVPGQVPAVPAVPEDPASRIVHDAAILDARRQKMDRETEFEEARLENDRRRRALKRRAELQQRMEEGGGEDGGYTFDGQGGPGGRLPVPFRPGLGGFPGRDGRPGPFSEMDAPITTKDMMHQRELDALREEARRVAERLERITEENRKPKSDYKELIIALGTVLSPILVKVMDINSQNAIAARESQNQFNRMMAESSNKQIELFTSVVGIRDKREENGVANMVKLIELGRDMGGSDGEGGGTVIEQIGKAGGDLIGGIVAALQANKQQAPPVMMHAAPQLPILRPPAVPMPGASLAPRAQAALPAPPEINPAQRVHSRAPEEHQVLQPVQEGVQMNDDAKMKVLARDIVQAALDEIDAKPAEPKWVKLAYENLPDDWIEAVANSNSYSDLTEMAKPYAPMKLLVFDFLPRFKSDAGVEPWLRTGYETLQKLCREAMVDDKGAAGDGSGGGDFDDGEIEG